MVRDTLSQLMLFFLHIVLRYGGVHLGPDRFKHINNVARTLLQTTGMAAKVCMYIIYLYKSTILW